MNLKWVKEKKITNNNIYGIRKRKALLKDASFVYKNEAVWCGLTSWVFTGKSVTHIRNAFRILFRTNAGFISGNLPKETRFCCFICIGCDCLRSIWFLSSDLMKSNCHNSDIILLHSLPLVNNRRNKNKEISWIRMAKRILLQQSTFWHFATLFRFVEQSNGSMFDSLR